MRNEGGGFAEILRLRSQLFWHSLSHIRRFSPLRMTKQGDARRWHASHESLEAIHPYFQTSNFKLQGSGVLCSIPTLKRKSMATKKDSVKRVFFVACYWLFRWEPERSGKFQTSAALLIFMRRTTISHF